MSRKKKIPENVLSGQQGVNLVERRVLQMGFLWHQRGAIEAGIDGTIELRDSQSGEVLNAIIQVQSKALTHFAADTKDSFEYLCDERDLAYWLQGNAPIILVVSRPPTDEAYWVPIKDYFQDPRKRKARRVLFNKLNDRFDQGCRPRLLRLSLSRAAGVYLGPPPSKETLYSNLLQVSSYGQRIFVAETPYRKASDLWERLAASSGAAGDWVLRSKRLISFRNLKAAPWDKVCDLGTLEAFDSTEWAQSNDPDRQREFVQLLNRCLRQKASYLGLRYDRAHDCYHFVPTRKLHPRAVSYRSLARNSRRTVFQVYAAKGTGGISYCRHAAFKGQFRRFDGQWFMEVTPTYHFTADGVHPYPWYAERLTGIKWLERNGAVLHQVLFWADYFREPETRPLFREDYGFLRFGNLMCFEIDVGIRDNDWLPHEEDSGTKDEAGEYPDLLKP